MGGRPGHKRLELDAEHGTEGADESADAHQRHRPVLEPAACVADNLFEQDSIWEKGKGGQIVL